MGLAGATADDAEAEAMRAITERNTVTGEALLARVAPVLISVCSSPAKYRDPTLQTAAGLALAKFMMVR